jgi:hypothetical protein
MFTVCAIGAGLLSTAGVARAAAPPPNDDIAAAQVIALSATSRTFDQTVSNVGATGQDDNADGALVTTEGAFHTLWYKFDPAPGRVSVTVSSSDIVNVVGGVVTSDAPDLGLDGVNDTFGVIGDGSVKNTDNLEGDNALTETTAPNDVETFSFSDDAHFVPDGQHDYYLGVGTVGDDDTSATGNITIAVTYTPAPANDDFVNAAPLANGTATYTGNTLSATPDLDDSNNNADPTVGLQTGMFSVWYKFTAPRRGRATFATTGSSFPVVWEVCSTTGTPSLETCQHVTDSGTAVPKSTGSFNLVAGTSYYLFLDGQLTPNFNDNASGRYKLKFTAVGAPRNDNVATPTVLKPSGIDRVKASNVGATSESNKGLTFNHHQKHSVFFRYTPARSGRVLLYTSGALDTDVEIFRGSVAAGFSDTHLGNDNYSAHQRLSRLAFAVTAHRRYFIAVDGSFRSGYPEGAFGLALGAVPNNDSLSAATHLSKGKGRVTGSTDFATFQSGEKSPKGFTGGADAWYTFVAPKAGTYTFSETLHGAAALLAAYSGKGASNLGLKLVKDASHAGSKKAATIALKAKAGEHFEISVDGSVGEFGAYTLTWK